MTLDMRYRDIKRVQPRANEYVNEIWLCDRGRYGHHFTSSPERITRPMVRRGDTLVETTWHEAIEEIAQRLYGIVEGYGSDGIAGLAGGRLPNEDLYLFQKLFREVLASPHIDSRNGANDEPEHEDFAYTYGVGANTNLGELGKGTTVLVIGADPEEEAPVYLLRLRGIARRNGTLIVANGRPTKLDAAATHTVTYRYGYETHFVLGLLSALLDAKLENADFLGKRVKQLDALRAALKPYSVANVAEQTGIPGETLETVAKGIADAENVVVMYGREALAVGEPLLQALANLLLLTGHVGRPNNGMIPLLRYNNSHGALDMGVRPDRGPGYTPLERTGMSARQILNAAAKGQINALYIAGLDPVAANPPAQAALQNVELLIVQDLFMTPTAQLADFILPAAPFAERDGTYTNAERRVQRFRAARDGADESHPDWQVFAAIGRTLSGMQTRTAEPAKRGRVSRDAAALSQVRRAWGYRSTDDINTEIVREVELYQNASYARLRAGGGVWGRQPVADPVYYDGTSYKNTEGLGVQWPALADDPSTTFELRFVEPRVLQPRAGEMLLVAAKRLYDGGTLMQASEAISYWVAEPYVGLAQADAERLHVRSGDRLRLSLDGSSIDLPVRVDGQVRPGMLLVPDTATSPLGRLQAGVVTSVTVEKVEG